MAEEKKDISYFRYVLFLEAVSYILLVFIAMPLKHIWDMPLAVRIVGMAHGLLFVLFVLMLLNLALKYKWKMSFSIGLFIASLLPIVPFFYDKKLKSEIAEIIED